VVNVDVLVVQEVENIQIPPGVQPRSPRRPLPPHGPGRGQRTTGSTPREPPTPLCYCRNRMMRRSLKAVVLMTLGLFHEDARAEAPQEKQELRLLARPSTPDLVGPDSLEPAPVLVVNERRTELDGRAMTLAELDKTLRILANNYRILYPDDPFNGKIIIACAPGTDTRRLGLHLELARAAGYPNPVFLFIRKSSSGRKDSSQDLVTAAAAITCCAGDRRPKGVTLKLRDHSNCLDLSKTLVGHRQHKRQVVLSVEKPQANRAKD